jgi:hypothetical protein
VSDFYVDAAAPDGGSGSHGSPWNSFGQWSNAAPGSRLIFRGGPSADEPRDYKGGGIWSAKNFILKAAADEFVRFTDTGAGGSLLTLEVWTGGMIDATEGGITFGPGNPNKPDDGSYWKGTLQLTGCTGVLLDGGPDRLLRFAGNSDIGLYLVDYPGGNHGPARGCRDIVAQSFETTELATGVVVRSSGTASSAPLGGQGVVLQDFWAHHHRLMLDNRGQGSDAGAVGFTLYACEGTVARRFDAFENYAASKDYGFDGGGFEVFAARDYVIEDFRMWDNEGGIETGRNGDLPLGTGGVIRRGTITGTSNRGGQDPPRSPTVLLRDFEDGRLEDCIFEISDTNELVVLYNDSGQYAGSIKRAAITGNTFVLAQDSDRAIMRVGSGGQALPTGDDAPTIDGNRYDRPEGGTVVGNDAHGVGAVPWAQWPAALTAMGVKGAEAHGTYGGTPVEPVEPPTPPHVPVVTVDGVLYVPAQ